MKDALDNLAKLPPKCATVMNDRAVFIARGAREPASAFMPTTQVEQWNVRNGVTQSQVRAMEVGVTLGWDADGADPGDDGDRIYRMVVPIAVEIEVRAGSSERATDRAFNRAEQVCALVGDHLNSTDWLVGIGLEGGPDIIDEREI